MAIKISELDDAAALTGDEVLPLVQGGVTLKGTITAIVESALATTLAALNVQITDATLIDTSDSRLSDARVPLAHDLDDHTAVTLAELSAAVTDAILARTDAAQSFTGLQTFSNGVAVGGNTVDDVLISTDGASVSDTSVVTAGWVDANVSGGAHPDPHYLGIGSAVLPPYSFDGDTDTGMYSDGSNRIAFTTGTQRRFIIDASGTLITINRGSEASPQLVAASSTTGVYWPDTSTFAVSTTGAEAARWDSAQKMTCAGDVEIDGDLDHDGSNVGFYGATPVAQQTGVAVSAAGIHAALVALGLITT